MRGLHGLACGLLALGAGSATHATEEALPEDELLEFLGALDGLDEDWMEYLEKTDVAEAARAKVPARPARAVPGVKEPEVKKP